MKKLEDIPKKNIFEVPDGYFDRLPMQIQERVGQSSPSYQTTLWTLTLRYALPVIIAGLALIYFLRPKSLVETEELLASISNEHLIAYLDETDILENELLELANFDEMDADSINFRAQSHYLLGGANENDLKRELDNEL